jgi:hypothetical protein
MGDCYLYECKLCVYSTKRVLNFEAHLLESHNLTLEQAYIDFILGGEQKFCECGCGQKTLWSWKAGYSKYVRGHNARDYSVFSDREKIEQAVEKRKEGYRTGRLKVWNSGLSIASDERIKNSTKKASQTLRKRYDSGEIIPWQTGLTKSTDARIEKMSQTKLKKSESGELIPWNRGLTKITSEKLEKISRSISSSYKKRSAGKRLSIETVKTRVEAAGFELVLEGEIDGYKTRKSKTLKVKCKKCDFINSKSLYSLEGSPRCDVCNPKDSSQQIEMYEFISSLGVKAIMSDRKKIKPYEIDILCESESIGFEYDGLYWHCEKFRDEFYHDRKRELSNSSGIKLYRIFEDEWENKRSVVESFIKHKLGVSKDTTFARRCRVIELGSSRRKKFFDESHLDGDVKCKFAYALEFDGKIIAAISIRKTFHKKWDEYYEVARFALAPDYSCPGAFSRLTKYALKYAVDAGKKGLISYVDMRHGDGDSYIKSGWNLASKTDPRFWWTDFDRRFDRFNFRADKNRKMTQKQVAAENKVEKIWGCSNLVFTLEHLRNTIKS